ncbi:MAG: lytic transglycosylase domain-containing protein [Candidatus Krumholzibacteriota bacterium]|nr:lytic transglycosylase domain-containing protein [Candidatus Krumholzibacteriota bacterium]
MKMRYERTFFFFLLFILSLDPARSGAVENGADNHLWRGEYWQALEDREEGKSPDRAAILTMAGDVERACRILDKRGDLFRAALVAFKAGDYDRVLERTGLRLDNEWLEIYRLMIRGKVLFETGEFPESAAETSRILSKVVEDPRLRDHHLINPVADLFVQAAVCSPTWHSAPALNYLSYDMLNGKSLLLLSRGYFAAGEVDKARETLIQALHKPGCDEAEELLAKLISEHHLDTLSFQEEEIHLLAEKAVRYGRSQSIRFLMRKMKEMGMSPYEYKYLYANQLHIDGNKRRALALFRELFRSPAAVSLKKEALLKIAMLEYGFKHYQKAAESYRLFGRYYPRDRRAEKYLDIAARIHAARGDWNGALKIWKELRASGVETSRGKEALLSEAVLRFWRGDTTGAHAILKSHLPLFQNRLKESAFYWLCRTGEDQETRDYWKSELMRQFPRSFYAAALREGPSIFTVEKEYQDPDSLLCRMESAEISYFDNLEEILPDSGTVATHPAGEAFFYFLECGLLEEAERCGEVLSRLYAHDRKELGKMYRHARLNGMAGFSISLLNAPAFYHSGDSLPDYLRYPVAFPGLLSRQISTRRIPAELVLGLIREESHFRRNAVSPAGACGLMQLLPSTGEWIGKKLERKSITREELFEPAINIEAGTWYLRFLLNRSQDSVIGTLAAYNAGSAKMSKWRKTFKPSQHPLIALEMIGLEETRAYVKKVLASMFIYRSLAAQNTELR